VYFFFYSIFFKHPMFVRSIVTIFACLWAIFPAYAQISLGGTPVSLQSEWASTLGSQRPAPIQLSTPDMAAIQAEDDQLSEQSRFAAPMSADISPATSGNWSDLSDGRRVWRCVVGAQGAKALVLLFDQFRLPVGSQFFAFTTDAQPRIFGAYSAESCSEEGVFTIGPIVGESVVLEYILPANSTNEGAIHLNRVDYGYHPSAVGAGTPAASADFGDALDCNVNINCPEGAAWQTQKRGVARILMVFSNGSAWCSGTLIANKTGSGIPYFLTAHHCQLLLNNPQFSQWAFHFDYESTNCDNPTTDPTYKSVLGATRIAFRAETDFLLLRLSPLPASYNLYFNGWTKSSLQPPAPAYIHHPMGDIKKFSQATQDAVSHTQSINWGPGFGTSLPNTHWRVVPTTGIYEPGSSGCPLFNPDKLIVGQLHGGVANQCSVTAAYFGMFHHTYDAGFTPTTRLREFLDPANTGAFSQSGYFQPPGPFNISGTVTAWWGPPMPNIKVVISGAKVDTVTTDSLGRYAFRDLLHAQNYSIKVLSPVDYNNGVTTLDLLKISQHILTIEAFDSPWKMLAADVNDSQTITAFDIVESRKLILTAISAFVGPSWKFMPADIVFANPQNPFTPNVPPIQVRTYNNLSAHVTNANFNGIKMGDVNRTATIPQ
jgi:hypothetical protein